MAKVELSAFEKNNTFAINVVFFMINNSLTLARKPVPLCRQIIVWIRR